MTDDPQDMLAKMRADLDQAIASFRETARLLRGHFDAQVAAGFTEPQALALTRDFQRLLFHGAIGGGED